MEFKEHIPSFIDNIEPKTHVFNSLDGLLAIPFVKKFSDNTDFSHYAVSDHKLMAIYKNNNGVSWWVLGYLSDQVDLPVWNANIELMTRK